MILLVRVESEKNNHDSALPCTHLINQQFKALRPAISPGLLRTHKTPLMELTKLWWVSYRFVVN